MSILIACIASCIINPLQIKLIVRSSIRLRSSSNSTSGGCSFSS
uniref:Uncharacterized protein n=1 Tax=Arundo donax TaxID=35708 RepID=A0A0A9HPC7_ARUDO